MDLVGEKTVELHKNPLAKLIKLTELSYPPKMYGPVISFSKIHIFWHKKVLGRNFLASVEGCFGGWDWGLGLGSE